MAFPRTRVNFGDESRLATTASVLNDQIDRTLAETLLQLCYLKLGVTQHVLVTSDAKGHTIEFSDIDRNVPYKILEHLHCMEWDLVRAVYIVPYLSTDVDDATVGATVTADVTPPRVRTKLRIELRKNAHRPLMSGDTMNLGKTLAVCYTDGATTPKALQSLDWALKLPQTDQFVLQYINYCVHHVQEDMPLLTTECVQERDYYCLRYVGFSVLNSAFLGFLAATTINFIKSISCKAVCQSVANVPGMYAAVLQMTIKVRMAQKSPMLTYDPSRMAIDRLRDTVLSDMGATTSPSGNHKSVTTRGGNSKRLVRGVLPPLAYYSPLSDGVRTRCLLGSKRRFIETTPASTDSEMTDIEGWANDQSKRRCAEDLSVDSMVQ